LIGLAGGEIDAIDARAVAEAASRGDRLGSGILGDATRAMAEALAHAVTLLAPRRIILGGGVSLVGEEPWFGPIRRQLDERVFAPFRGTFDVVPASLGEAVVIHGALALAVDEMTAQHARPTSQADHPSPISPGGHASGVTLS
jgi:glucokinase